MALVTLKIIGDNSKSSNTQNYGFDPASGSNFIEDVPNNQPYSIEKKINPETEWLFDSPAFHIEIVPIGGAIIESVTTNINYTSPDGGTISQYQQGNTFVFNGAYSSMLNISNNEDVVFTVKYVGGVETETPFNRTYLLDKTALDKFAREEMAVVDPVTNDSDSKTKYIVSMMSFPFPIDESLLTSEKMAVAFGKYGSNIQAHLVLTDTLPVFMGEIQLPDLKNSVELSASKFSLYMPLMEVIELETSIFNGAKISINLLVDVYSGTSTVNIVKNGEVKPSLSVQRKIGKSLPIQTYMDVTQAFEKSQLIENVIKTAYVEHEKKVLVEGDGMNLVKVSGKLEDATGLCFVDEIYLAGEMTVKEKADIKVLLSQGVYIN